jgi:FkbM family methyltransferase
MNVVDGGARYGLHPTWQPLKDLANFHLFDIDGDECNRLQKKYSGNKNIKIYNMGLYSEQATKVSRQCSHKAITTLCEVDNSQMKQINHVVDESQVETEGTIHVDTLDNIFQDKDVDFIKLDVEGTELDVLKGAKNQLEQSVLGVRCEVLFKPLYKRNVSFGEINAFLEKLGFELVNLDYDGKGKPMSAFTTSDRYGYLMVSDAVWIKRWDILAKQHLNEEFLGRILLLSIFLFLNNAEDIAMNCLLRLCDEYDGGGATN